jgi:hypothetical protein
VVTLGLDSLTRKLGDEPLRLIVAWATLGDYGTMGEARQLGCADIVAIRRGYLSGQLTQRVAAKMLHHPV